MGTKNQSHCYMCCWQKCVRLVVRQGKKVGACIGLFANKSRCDVCQMVPWWYIFYSQKINNHKTKFIWPIWLKMYYFFQKINSPLVLATKSCLFAVFQRRTIGGRRNILKSHWDPQWLVSIGIRTIKFSLLVQQITKFAYSVLTSRTSRIRQAKQLGEMLLLLVRCLLSFVTHLWEVIVKLNILN